MLDQLASQPAVRTRSLTAPVTKRMAERVLAGVDATVRSWTSVVTTFTGFGPATAIEPCVDRIPNSHLRRWPPDGSSP